MLKIFIILSLLSINLFSSIKFGIDVLAENNYNLVENKNIALLTNHSGRDINGNSSISHFVNKSNINLKRILVPEHGYFSAVPAGEHVENEKFMGIDLISLYGKERKPSKQTLIDIDLVVIDIQDIGVRSYTYISTVFNVLDACAEFDIEVLVLDRPNPLGGYIVDGNIVDKGMESFVSLIPISYIHGLTIGELCLYINNENLLSYNRKCKLEIVKMDNWKRWMIWDDTNINWFPTSPHIPTVEAIKGNTALGIIGELGIISIGIGTTLPFQYLGSPTFDRTQFKITLKKIFPEIDIETPNINIDGLELIEAKFFPYYGMYSNKYCNGYLIKYSGKNDMKPFSAGLKILITLREMYPKEFETLNSNNKAIAMFKKVTGTELIWSYLNNKKYNLIFEKVENERLEFILKRNKYLLY